MDKNVAERADRSKKTILQLTSMHPNPRIKTCSRFVAPLFYLSSGCFACRFRRLRIVAALTNLSHRVAAQRLRPWPTAVAADPPIHVVKPTNTASRIASAQLVRQPANWLSSKAKTQSLLRAATPIPAGLRQRTHFESSRTIERKRLLRSLTTAGKRL